MKRTLMSNKKRDLRIFFSVLCCFTLGFIGFCVNLNAASSLSLSIGLPFDGALKNGEVLPRSGDGYTLMKTATERRARFGVSELIQMIKWSSFLVHRQYGGEKAAVGDLSMRTGGEFEHHASHQNGRDVDIAFYALNRKGNSVRLNNMIPFDKNGFSIDPPMSYQFDTKRNWALISEMIGSSKAQVQWIFVARHIEELLLAYAEDTGVSAKTIRQAEQVLKQPSNSSHFDHFHVRIYCPEGDKPHCKDHGPKWAWYR
jgi:murein endopeptidase